MKTSIVFLMILVSIETIDAQRIRFKIPVNFQHKIERWIVQFVKRIGQDFANVQSQKFIKDYVKPNFNTKITSPTNVNKKKTPISDCDMVIFCKSKRWHELAKIYTSKCLNSKPKFNNQKTFKYGNTIKTNRRTY